jgi:hypothetical protein
VDAGSVTADNFRPFSYDSTENLVTTLIRQYGGTLTEVDTTQTGKGYVNFNNEKTIQAKSSRKGEPNEKNTILDPLTADAYFFHDSVRQRRDITIH